MKAVVLEVRDGVAAVLRSDGVVVKVRQKCSVGDVIEVRSKRAASYRWMRAVSVAAAAAVFATAGTGLYRYNTVLACSYVSLDINPSIDFTLNRMDKVISVSALNEDAEPVVEALEKEKVKGDTLQEALEKTEAILVENNYITDDELDYVLINVASDSDKRKERLSKEATQVFGQNEESVQLVVTEATTEDHSTAKGLGISSGRYKEYETITEQAGSGSGKLDASVVSQFKDYSVREIMVQSGQIPDEPKGMQTAPAGDSTGSAGAVQNINPGQPAGPAQNENGIPSGSEETPGMNGAGNGNVNGAVSGAENAPPDHSGDDSGLNENGTGTAAESAPAQNTVPSGETGAADMQGPADRQAPEGNMNNGAGQTELQQEMPQDNAGFGGGTDAGGGPGGMDAGPGGSL